VEFIYLDEEDTRKGGCGGGPANPEGANGEGKKGGGQTGGKERFRKGGRKSKSWERGCRTERNFKRNEKRKKKESQGVKKKNTLKASINGQRRRKGNPVRSCMGWRKGEGFKTKRGKCNRGKKRQRGVNVEKGREDQKRVGRKSGSPGGKKE